VPVERRVPFDEPEKSVELDDALFEAVETVESEGPEVPAVSLEARIIFYGGGRGE
jgi:hypothetical protein